MVFSALSLSFVISLNFFLKKENILLIAPFDDDLIGPFDAFFPFIVLAILAVSYIYYHKLNLKTV